MQRISDVSTFIFQISVFSQNPLTNELFPGLSVTFPAVQKAKAGYETLTAAQLLKVEIRNYIRFKNRNKQ